MLKSNDPIFLLKPTLLRLLAGLLLALAFLAGSGCTTLPASQAAPTDKALKQKNAKKYLRASPLVVKGNEEKSLADHINHIYSYNNAEVLQAIEIIEGPNQKHSNGIASMDIDWQIRLAVLLSKTQKNSDTKRALKILNQQLTDYSTVMSTEYNEFISLFISIINSNQQTQNLLQQQAQQIREKNQAIQSLNDKINALKVIEKNLGAR